MSRIRDFVDREWSSDVKIKRNIFNWTIDRDKKISVYILA